MTKRQLDRAVAGIVRQVVELVHPRRIILFGSAAAGRARPDSDLDVLVVIDESQRQSDITDLLYTRIRDKALPCDFLVTTSSCLRRQRHNPGLIYSTIIEQGKEVYAG
jgi:predicted nucleotidyltransferase